jgi:Inner membrane component of T3SS, cytoplasmic domain
MIETTLPPHNATTSQLLGNTVGEMSFRIRGGEHSGRVVRIRAQKCTIGSAADCTLRLNAPGVGNLHCLILRGEAGVVARRWSSNTLLNGGTFSDALLTLGDRLQIGPLELEFLGDASDTSHQVEHAKPRHKIPSQKLVRHEITRADSGNEDYAKQLTYVRLVSKQKLRRCKKRISQLKQRLQQIEKAYRKSQNERQRFQGQAEFAEDYRKASELQMQRLTSESQTQTLSLERVRQELEEARRSLLQQNEKWLQSKQEWQDILLTKQSEISNTEATTNELRRALTQKQAESDSWAASQAELQTLRLQYEQTCQAYQKSQATETTLRADVTQFQKRVHDLTQALSTTASTDATLNTLQAELHNAQQKQNASEQQLLALQET